ncbi:MAG: hypothetical protein QXR09_02425 [Candidatus Aenigmatarchaeota archaeon]
MGKIIGHPTFGEQTPYVEKRIEDMKIGEVGYAKPYALSFDEDGTAYLNVEYLVVPHPEGEYRMKIRRVGKDMKDFEIDVRGVNYKWSIGKPIYVGTPEEKIVPICKDYSVFLHKLKTKISNIFRSHRTC